MLTILAYIAIGIFALIMAILAFGPALLEFMETREELKRKGWLK